MDRTHELEEHLRRLNDEVQEMRSRMARLEGMDPGHKNGAEPKNRRGFLKFGAGAVLGAVGMAAAKVVPAIAATGGNFLLGCANTAGATTGLTGEAANPNPTLKVQAFAHDPAKLTAAVGSIPLAGSVQALGADGGFEGIDAFASSATSYAVYGLTDAGVGVTGESNTGIGLYARRSGRIRQEGLATAGPPSYSPNLYEQVRDNAGVLWIHGTAANSWRRVNTLRTDTPNGSGAFKPVRVFDSRNGGGAIKGPGSVTVIPMAGVGGIPADAIGVVGNLTAAGYPGGGFLAIMPSGTVGYNPATDPSSINFIVGQYAIANSFVCGLSGGALQVVVGNLPGANASHFIVDITAYIQ